MSQRILVIVNPAAARARRAWPKVRARLGENGLDFDVHETAFAGDATRATREALRAGYNTVAVVGGDGTLSEAVAGFFDFEEDEQSNQLIMPTPVSPDAALAILPAGTGDDFARGLAGKREPVEEWVRRLIAHARDGDSKQSRPVDVIAGRATSANGWRSFICLNVSTIGLGAEVAVRVAGQGRFVQRLPGEARFLKAACQALLMWRERRMRVKVDESEALECASNLIAVANNVYAGGGMMFAPEARTDDGLIDLMLSCKLTRRTIIRELPRIHRGGHINNPNVTLFKAKRVRLEPLSPGDSLPVEADGNPRGHTPAEFQIMPGALRIVTSKKQSAVSIQPSAKTSSSSC
ncbi:MAG: diacylglycerol kinase family lipid kinase [Pyrinomonadaceae bacterium]|nr:diacylglycerol kinase family lipid kinase [Pyrinomonadaceae bacterium]